MSTNAPGFQSFFCVFLPNILMAKLATSSIRVNSVFKYSSFTNYPGIEKGSIPIRFRVNSLYSFMKNPKFHNVYNVCLTFCSIKSLLEIIFTKYLVFS